MKPRKVKPPVASFVSPGGRTFTIDVGDKYKSPRDGTCWMIRFEGEPAGVLWRDTMYAAPLEWHASTRQIYWRKASDAPTGIGFDVSAFATIDDVLAAWSRSVDQILDWNEGKVVRSIYSKTGSYQRMG